MNIDFSTLEKHLEHKIKDYEMFELALTHRSVGKKDSKGQKLNNERLEFLGDRVLNFTIAELVFNKFPDKTEGHLSKLHAALVSQTTLAKIAKDLQLNEILQLGKGEMMSGGAEKPTLLSDAVESILAALYKDAGLGKAKSFIVKHWEPLIDTIEIKDPKTTLQEYYQNISMPLPEYEIVDERGPAHERIYVIKVSTPDGKWAIAEGTSKQEGQLNAARKLVKALTKNKDEK
jgi:ribonuclease-3